VRLVSDHVGEYPSLTAASSAVAKQLDVGKESVLRWVIQAEVDDGGSREPRARSWPRSRRSRPSSPAGGGQRDLDAVEKV